MTSAELTSDIDVAGLYDHNDAVSTVLACVVSGGPIGEGAAHAAARDHGR